MAVAPSGAGRARPTCTGTNRWPSRNESSAGKLPGWSSKPLRVLLSSLSKPSKASWSPASLDCHLRPAERRQRARAESKQCRRRNVPDVRAPQVQLSSGAPQQVRVEREERVQRPPLPRHRSRRSARVSEVRHVQRRSSARGSPAGHPERSRPASRRATQARTGRDGEAGHRTSARIRTRWWERMLAAAAAGD